MPVEVNLKGSLLHAHLLNIWQLP